VGGKNDWTRSGSDIDFPLSNHAEEKINGGVISISGERRRRPKQSDTVGGGGKRGVI